MKLDRTNLKILEILAQNCRVTDATLSRALSVSKDTTAYRIRQLQDSGVIKQYVLFVDARKLGFTRYHILLQFEAGKLPGPDILKRLSAHPFVMWINTFVGRFDLQIIMDAKDGFHLNSIREELFSICQQKIKHYSVMTHLFDLEFTQLNPVLNFGTSFDKSDPQTFGPEITRRNFPVSSSFKRVSIDRSENEILRYLADDPTVSISELAEKIGLERVTVRKKIERLVNEKVILNFGAIPDLTSLGFITYYLLIRLSQGIPEKTLKKPFESLRNIFYSGFMLGDYDMIAYLNARNPSELHESIGKFRQDLGPHIVNFDLLVQERVISWRQYTQGIYESVRKNFMTIR